MTASTAQSSGTASDVNPNGTIVIARLLRGEPVANWLQPEVLGDFWNRVALQILAAGTGLKARAKAFQEAIAHRADREMLNKLVFSIGTDAEPNLEPDPEPEDTWQVLTLADAYADRPAAEYAVDGQIKLPSVNITHSHPGAMKSLLKMHQAVCISAGRPWLEAGIMYPDQDLQPFTTKRLPVMWVNFDNDTDTVLDRFAALARFYELAPDDIDLYIYSLPEPGFDATNSDSIAAMSRRIRHYGVRVVYFDVLTDIKGSANENSDEMQPVMQAFRMLASEYKAAIELIHHENKAGGGPGGRSGSAIRGWSGIEGKTDLGLRVERSYKDGEPEDTLKITPSKVRGLPVKAFAADFHYKTKPGTKELLTCSFFRRPVETAATQKEDKAAGIKKIILDVLGSEQLNQKTLTERAQAAGVKAVARTIHGYIEQLVTEKKVSVVPGKGTEKLYTRAEGKHP
jgi:hypothetical protein